ncbi:hypothetical protein F4780DRAFT_736432 [Xylariomycetidae sp. FL0641]|nr:hypothetical protein F4780DRAFT_736432 [Xylariomycetidae sp. FL0641]
MVRAPRVSSDSSRFLVSVHRYSLPLCFCAHSVLSPPGTIMSTRYSRAQRARAAVTAIPGLDFGTRLSITTPEICMLALLNETPSAEEDVDMAQVITDNLLIIIDVCRETINEQGFVPSPAALRNLFLEVSFRLSRRSSWKHTEASSEMLQKFMMDVCLSRTAHRRHSAYEDADSIKTDLIAQVEELMTLVNFQEPKSRHRSRRHARRNAMARRRARPPPRTAAPPNDNAGSDAGKLYTREEVEHILGNSNPEAPGDDAKEDETMRTKMYLLRMEMMGWYNVKMAAREQMPAGDKPPTISEIQRWVLERIQGPEE